MTGLNRFVTTFLAAAAIAVPQALHAQRSSAPEGLFRLDDIGMNHSVNLALEQVAKTGMQFSATLPFRLPWSQEGVDLLKEYPQVDVWVQLAPNFGGRGSRWGAVLGKGGVPS